MTSSRQENTPDASSGSKRRRNEADGSTLLSTNKERSDVWNHFTKLQDDQNKCKCHYCSKVRSCKTKSGTSNLFNHLSSCKSYIAWKQTQSQTQHVISLGGDEHGGPDNMYLAKINESVFRKATNEMLVLGELPLAFIESVAWKHFCSQITHYKPQSLMYYQFDVLSWWRGNSHKFPVLSEIAKDVLAMQVSSVASESAFSTSGRIVEPQRSCLTHYMIEVLMCTEQWLKSGHYVDETVENINQMIADIEEQDRLYKEFEYERQSN